MCSVKGEKTLSCPKDKVINYYDKVARFGHSKAIASLCSHLGLFKINQLHLMISYIDYFAERSASMASFFQTPKHQV